MNMIDSRLRIIDEFLAEGKYIKGPAMLKKILNQERAKGDGEIGIERTKQLLSELRKLVRAKGVSITDPKVGGYRYFPHVGFRYFNDSVNEDDKNMLLIANSMFNVFSGTGMHENFGFVVNKILKNQNRRGEIKGINHVKLIELGSSLKDPGLKWLQPIVKSMLEGKSAIEVKYRKSETDVKMKTLSPYIIKQHESKWYLVAFDHSTSDKHKTKIFTLSKIESVNDSFENFHIDTDFSAEDYFKYSIGIWQTHNKCPIKVHIKITKPELFKSLKKDPIHQSQIIISETEEIIEIEVFDTTELNQLILKFGSEIKVIKPASLVKYIKTELENAASQYK